MLTQEEALKLLRYDPETGKLYRRLRGGAFKEATNIGAQGYVRVRVNTQLYTVHRVVWLMHNGPIPAGYQVDHRDGDRTNNRLDNLRLASHTDNCRNSGRRADNTSGFKGVSWEARRSAWLASVCASGRIHWIGRFKCPRDAARAYDAAAIQHHGEFAKTNAMLGLL